MYEGGWILWTLCAVLVTAAPARAGDAPAFQVAPPGAWVDVADLPAPSAASASSGGRRDLLIDEQTRVDSTVARFSRFAYQIVETAGVEDSSELRIEFDPSYETLTIHDVRLRRGAHTIDALQPSEVKLLQRESDLDARIFDGSLTAVIIVKDVRVGDIIDYSYTITGANPVFDGKVASGCRLGSYAPAARVRCRLLWPSARPLHTWEQGIVPPKIIEHGDTRELVWERKDVAAIPIEDDAPGWYDPFPRAAWSEFGSWGEVARWSASHQPPSVDATIKAQVQAWTSLPTAEAKFLAALRFVQKEVRYLGIELGPNSHQPHRPEEVLAHRFGDCKDKSLLLVSLLKELGVEAAPALVNTRLEQEVRNRLPSPLLFDHEIVRAVVGGHEYWVDPTASYEAGPLSQELPPPYRFGLVVAENTTDLAAIPYPKLEAPTTVSDEVYDLGRLQGPARLTVTTRLTFDDADAARRGWAAQRAQVEQHALNAYAAYFPSIQLDGHLTVEDDPVANVFVIHEAYVIPDPTPKDRLEMPSLEIESVLSRPRIRVRQGPVSVRYPAYVSQTVHVRVPDASTFDSATDTLEDSAVRLTSDERAIDGEIVLKYTLQTLSDHVDAKDAAKHFELLDRIMQKAGGSLKMPEDGVFRRGLHSGSELSAKETLVLACVIGALVSAFLGFNWWRDRRNRVRRTQFSSRRRVGRGETPHTALRVATMAHLLAETRAMRCDSCRTPYGKTDLVLQESVLGDTKITSTRLHCPQCNEERPVYFVVEGPSQVA